MKKLDLPAKTCLQCGAIFDRCSCKRVSDFKEKKFCSKECYHAWNTKENHPLWKGGVKSRPDGYLRDSKTDKYIHRIVMEEYLGRTLEPYEHIHHIDGDTSNNNIENLQLFSSNSEHRQYEVQLQKRGKDGRFIE